MKSISNLLMCSSNGESKDCFFYVVIILEIFYREGCIFKSLTKLDDSVVLSKNVQKTVREIRININFIYSVSISDSFLSFVNFFPKVVDDY